LLLLLLTIKEKCILHLHDQEVLVADKPTDLVQGTLDMLILRTVALEPMHGYGITVRLEHYEQFRPIPV
jgi:hypothetical protein